MGIKMSSRLTSGLLWSIVIFIGTILALWWAAVTVTNTLGPNPPWGTIALAAIIAGIVAVKVYTSFFREGGGSGRSSGNRRGTSGNSQSQGRQQGGRQQSVNQNQDANITLQQPTPATSRGENILASSLGEKEESPLLSSTTTTTAGNRENDPGAAFVEGDASFYRLPISPAPGSRPFHDSQPVVATLVPNPPSTPYSSGNIASLQRPPIDQEPSNMEPLLSGAHSPIEMGYNSPYGQQAELPAAYSPGSSSANLGYPLVASVPSADPPEMVVTGQQVPGPPPKAHLDIDDKDDLQQYPTKHPNRLTKRQRNRQIQERLKEE